MSTWDDFGLSEETWRSLCRRIKAGACVPVIGAQLRRGTVPLADELAAEWAKSVDYPLARKSELAMVAEFVKTKAPDEDELVESFRQVVDKQKGEIAEEQIDDNRCFRLLAELPLDSYITTAFDDLMAWALRRYRPNCAPRSVSCPWDPPNRYWQAQDEIQGLREPTYEEPIVFHLHGRWNDPPSMVLTESDHMEFMAKIALDSTQDVKRSALLPPVIRTALASRSWFFLGYGAADRNLRGLLRALGSQVHNTKHAVAVQLQQDVAAEGKEVEADKFLTEYFARLLGRDSGDVDVVLSEAVPFLESIKEEIEGGQDAV